MKVLASLALAALIPSTALAQTSYCQIDFPMGDVSFADVVLEADPAFGGNAGSPGQDWGDSQDSLGAPDHGGACGPVSGVRGAYSISCGGLLRLGFTDNLLSNSGTADPDLHVFEVGPVTEITVIGIRPTSATLSLLVQDGFMPDAEGYFDIGESGNGGVDSIDIDGVFQLSGVPYQTGALAFDAVRLIDNPNQGGTCGGGRPGPDIDAVGAIFSIEAPREFCFGDGGDQAGCTDCPCGNNAMAGTIGGCLNSRGISARLASSGAPSLSAGSLNMTLRGGGVSTYAILVSGDNRLPVAGLCPAGSGMSSALQDGLICVAGNRFHHGTLPTDGQGDVGFSNPAWASMLTNAGFVAGQTRHFQVLYRDDALLSCGTGENSTNALSVTVEP